MFNIPCINITKKNTTSKPLLNIHHFLAGNLGHKSDLYISKSGDIFVQYLQQIIVIMGCRHNLVNGRRLKVNTAKHSSEKVEDGTHPPQNSHYCA